MKRKMVVLSVCLLIVAGLNFAQQGYVAVGHTWSYTHGTGDTDFLIYQLDLTGATQWQKNLGGLDFDFGRSIQQTRDGGYIVAGQTTSYTHGGWDFLIYKLDASGGKLWRKNFGGEEDDWSSAIQQTTDGGYVVAGLTESFTHGVGDRDYLIYKLDANGGKLWRKNLGGKKDDWPGDIQQTTDGGYVIAGTAYSYTHGTGDTDILIYKLDGTGAKQWRKHLGGIQFDQGTSIQQTKDGGYVVAGYSTSYTQTVGYEDFLVYKLNGMGQKQWRKNFGGAKSDEAWAVQQTTDGGYIVAGMTWSYVHGPAGDQDVLIYKLDATGTQQLQRNLGGTELDRARSIQQTKDGGYILCGDSMSFTFGGWDFLIYKLDPNLRKQWRKNLGGDLDDFGYDIQLTGN